MQDCLEKQMHTSSKLIVMQYAAYEQHHAKIIS